MVAFNFSPEFADDVASGKKRQTIRQTKRGKVGDPVQLFTGQRTKQCRRLRQDEPVLEAVSYIHIAPTGISLGNIANFPRDRDDFAKADGFKDFAAMHAWFKAKYGQDHFYGYVHRWALANHLTNAG